MTAPRVPAGWTREAADLVWEDWRAALVGGDPSPLCMGSDIDPALCHALELTGFVSAWTYPDDDHPSELRYIGAWKSPEARLRAWGAVGAPVLAPAEDGRPSLAEWIAAMGASHWGEPLTIDTMPGGEPFIARWLTGPIVRLWPKRHPENPGAHVCLVAPYTRFGPEVWRDCATPEQLRALLDTLAKEPR